VIQDHPELYEIAYSLGLLLAEMKKYDQAAMVLEKAAKGMPKHARVHYNLGLLCQYLKRDEKAEQALLKALEIDPNSMEYLYALADFYLKREQFQKAKNMAQQMVMKHPNEPIGQELLGIIMRKLPKANQ